MAPREQSVTLRLAAKPSAVGQARDAVRDMCCHLAESTVSDAALLVSELVTNAVRHAGGMITIVVDCVDGRVAVAVGDHCIDAPTVRELDLDAQNGRGLALVDAIATRWGCNPSTDGEGKTVWFTLASQR